MDVCARQRVLKDGQGFGKWRAGRGVGLAFVVGWSGGSLPGERRGLGKGVERTAWEEQEQEPEWLTGVGEGLSDAIGAVRWGQIAKIPAATRGSSDLI